MIEYIWGENFILWLTFIEDFETIAVNNLATLALLVRLQRSVDPLFRWLCEDLLLV
jgi:hypothetical protein